MRDGVRRASARAGERPDAGELESGLGDVIGDEWLALPNLENAGAYSGAARPSDRVQVLSSEE